MNINEGRDILKPSFRYRLVTANSWRAVIISQSLLLTLFPIESGIEK